MAYYKPIEQQLAMKIQNNASCPCKSGKKYKHCCKGVQLFFSSEKRKQEAEYHILQREEQIKNHEAKLNGANKGT